MRGIVGVFYFIDMSKDPAFLFYSNDFITGVSDLTMEERGQFITLLCIQHQKGSISSKWLSINLPNASSDVLSKFEKDEEGNYFNIRLVEETEKRSKHIPRKKAAAILGGLISANKVSKAKATKIKAEFDIKDYQDLEGEEMKICLTKWFKQMLNLLENENEDVNSINIKVFQKPTFEEIKSYFIENGYSIQSAKKAFDYYESAKWKDSKGNQVKNWKQKMIGVWFKDENKQTAMGPVKRKVSGENEQGQLIDQFGEVIS